jgi:hypothetical protein
MEVKGALLFFVLGSPLLRNNSLKPLLAVEGHSERSGRACALAASIFFLVGPRSEQDVFPCSYCPLRGWRLFFVQLFGAEGFSRVNFNFGLSIRVATVDDRPGVGGYLARRLVDHIPENVALARRIDSTHPQIATAIGTGYAAGKPPIEHSTPADIERLAVRSLPPVGEGRSSMANDLALVVVNVISLG